ncbi:MAG: hypothetical protein V7784_14735 [Oceanospirillaceae bacterium]
MTKTLTILRFTCFCILLAILSGCSNNPNQPFRIESLAKSELDMVIDAHLTQTNSQAIELMKKLYKRNPKELKKAPAGTSINTRTKQLFGFPRQVQFNELGNTYANSALINTFNPDFKGDRVFSFMAGVAGILHSSYNFQDEFFMLDAINEQKIYNSARNLETASWLLNNRKDTQNILYLLSNSYTSQSTANLSYARLFGKIIASQDILANIIANRNNRTINKVLHGFASTTLLPI